MHYMEQYDVWALASFDAVWQVCSDTESFSVRRGQTPLQILLGEPATNLTFPSSPPEHRPRRRVFVPSYTRREFSVRRGPDSVCRSCSVSRRPTSPSPSSTLPSTVRGDACSRRRTRAKPRRTTARSCALIAREVLDGVLARATSSTCSPTTRTSSPVGSRGEGRDTRGRCRRAPRRASRTRSGASPVSGARRTANQEAMFAVFGSLHTLVAASRADP